MGNKSSPVLTLSLLLISALCLEAFIIERVIYLRFQEMSWTEARQYCQKNHIDLITWKVVTTSYMAAWLLESNVSQIWIGLHRDPEINSSWKWINVKTGVGLSGNDLSQSTNWADGQHSGHCAAVGDDQMWYSELCSSGYNVYCSSGDKIKYHRVNLSWFNASLYCKEEGEYLTTATKTNIHSLTDSGWIGLYQLADNNWNWIGDGPSDYRNWAPGEPLSTDCAAFNSVTQMWYSKKCSKELPVVCYGDNLLLVNENKTWEEALRYCRAIKKHCYVSGSCTYLYDILSLPDLHEYSYVRDRIYKATADEVWVGLHFLGGGWWWMNGMEPAKHEMLTKCPPRWNRCGTVSKYDTNNWITRNCSERRNFLCYKRSI